MSFYDGVYELDESQRLEFKEAAVGLPDDVWETYSALANTEGGEIVLGVREDAENHTFHLEGVNNPTEIVDDFWKTIRNPDRVERDIMLADGVKTLNREGMIFVVIDVPRAERDEKPVRVYDRRRKSYVAYVRRGSGDFKATDEDLRLMQYDNAPSADRKPLSRFDRNALCAETIQRYRNVFAANKPQSPWNADSDDDFLYHIGALAKQGDGALAPTQAGLLAFGYEYEITNYLPNYLLDYREETSEENRWDDRVVSQSGDWSGNLIDFYFMVTERLVRRFSMPFSTDETGTRHGSRNPLTEAVNEAVANALVHAYYGAAASVRVIFTKASVEVYNPGSLLIDRDVAIAGGFSETRNPTLMRIMGFIGATDRAGSGLHMIWDTWDKTFGVTPVLEEAHAPASVRVSLPLSGFLSESSASSFKVSRHDMRIMTLVSGSAEGMSSLEVGEALGLSERVVQKRLKALYDAGRIDRVRDKHAYRYRAVR